MADWTDDQIQEIWEKATPVSGYDENVYRKDQKGAWIQRDMNTPLSLNEPHTSLKWQVDHITPVSKGGEDTVSNARPLQWYNNDCRQNGRLKTFVTSEGNHNIEVNQP